ncbi:MAG: type II toxin-antitoxin system RelE/ParE family toxin [Acidaminobacter sp.]|nr:type II toxin-antitoxin system RelE/ParE family toxin [Acidaminobacter sp.]MDK9712361.1 type II toxin-antitoxin system RelE/ParE family toxin [Acidaminobacter sp.]MZQ97603.1 type II toxin-antitoxin system RelE/ParE family toxin [Acidaminobacter sp.]
MCWRIEYLNDAVKDLKKLDHSQKLQVLKAIEKVSTNPLPTSEGGYGKPLSNHSNIRLAGLQKIKLVNLGIRVVYKVIRTDSIMLIIVISVREDQKVYEIADSRVNGSQ